MSFKIDEVGKRYGKLVVIEEAGRIRRWVSWKCRCDCGNETIVSGVLLRDGRTRSCGCLRKFAVGEAAFNHIFHGYRAGAEKRKLKFELTKEQFREMTQQNCYYCDQMPSRVSSPNGTNGDYTYNGIDRIDNEKGYTMDNCVSCCKECNLAKGTKSVEEFLSWLDRIAKYQGYY